MRAVASGSDAALTSDAARTSDAALASEWRAVMTRYHHTACALDRELSAQHDLSVSEFELLQLLSEATDSCNVRMHDLADEVHLSQSALSRVITRLERDGLVERLACDADRRSIFVAITDAGSARYLEARPTQRAILRAQTESA
jgi:DNA-binding MarR family transcriptional regulator